jgi:hypothetical protein
MAVDHKPVNPLEFWQRLGTLIPTEIREDKERAKREFFRRDGLHYLDNDHARSAQNLRES